MDVPQLTIRAARTERERTHDGGNLFRGKKAQRGRNACARRVNFAELCCC